MNHLLTCRCGEVVLKSRNGITKLRTKIVVFKDGESFVVCKGCGVELPIPISIDSNSLKKSRNPKLFLYNLDLK